MSTPIPHSHTHSTTHPNITTPTPNPNIEDNFAQTKEDFDISSIPDSDSEDGITIYYQAPESRKRVSGSLNLQKRDDKITYDSLISTLNGDDALSLGLFEATSPVRGFIPSRLSTPTTDELIGYINDTDLLGFNNKKSTVKSLASPEKKAEELARLREVITRSKIPDFYHKVPNSPSTLAETPALIDAQELTAQLPSSTPRIRDFTVLPPPTVSISQYPSTSRALGFKDFPEYQTLYEYTYPSSGHRTCDGNKWMDPHLSDESLLQSFVPIQNGNQDEIDMSPVENSSVLVPISCSRNPSQRTMEVCDNYLHIVHDEKTGWNKISNSHANTEDKDEEQEKEEEFHHELSSREEADDEEYPCGDLLPRALILGKQDTRDLPKINELEDSSSLFQLLPQHLQKIRKSKENTLPELRSLAILAPQIQLPIPELPREIPQRYQYPRIDAWPTIALAYDIPLFPTHILTCSSLEQLSHCEKAAQFENGYSDSVIDRWALTQHRLFLWINSRALEDGIDGGFSRVKSADLLLGLDGSSSEIWDYEDVEVFARAEPGGFRGCLEWVWEVDVYGEEEEGSVRSWEMRGDELYDSFGGEEILHRSVSVVDDEEEEEEGGPSSSECIEEEYDAEDERGAIGFRCASPAILPLENGKLNINHDPRLGRVVNIFRTRELQRLRIRDQDSPFRHPIQHAVFRENGIRAVDYAQANAMERFERVAEDFARGRREFCWGGESVDSEPGVGFEI